MPSLRQIPILLAFVIGFLWLGAHTADAGTITAPEVPPEREHDFPEDPDNSDDESAPVNEPPPGPVVADDADEQAVTTPGPVETPPPRVLLGDVKPPPKK